MIHFFMIEWTEWIYQSTKWFHSELNQFRFYFGTYTIVASFVEDSDEKQLFFFSFPLKNFGLYFDFYGAEKKKPIFFLKRQTAFYFHFQLILVTIKKNDQLYGQKGNKNYSISMMKI